MINELLDNNGTKLLPENSEGNIEYKLRLDRMSESKLEKMRSQMRWRLNEGDGTTFYVIGVFDNGNFGLLTKDEFETSVKLLEIIVEKEKFKISHVEIISTRNSTYGIIKIEGEVNIEFFL